MVKKVELVAADDHTVITEVDAPPDALEALAREAEAKLTPPPLGDGVTDLDVSARDQAGVPVMTNSQCLMMGAQVLRETLEAVAKLTSPATTMADAKLQKCADALGAVFDKHKWNLQAMGGAYVLEFTAMMTVAPIAYAAYVGIQAEIKARPTTEIPAKETPPTAAAGVALNADADAATRPPQFAPGDPRSVTLNGGAA